MARRRPPSVHGVAVVDKPAGMTSHDVVGQLRRRLNERRVGHAGTLDPDATGVLVVGVGHATRLLRFVTDSRKSYVGEVVFGTETSTLDAAGDVTATHDMGSLTFEKVREAAATHLVGDIEQIPPMVSAIKIGGRRLHELARAGEEVDREPRPVTIHRLEVESTDEPLRYRIEVDCSSGTYIRVIAADLGHLLGGGAHLATLRRTAVGAFTLAEAAPPDECELLGIEAAVRSLPRVKVDTPTAARIRNGAVLDAWQGEGPWAVFTEDDTLLAVYEPHKQDQAKPAVVLPPT